MLVIVPSSTVLSIRWVDEIGRKVELNRKVCLTESSYLCKIERTTASDQEYEQDYEKGSPETGLFESQFFAINDELLKDFLTTQNVKIPPMTEELGAQVSPMSERLVAYACCQ